MAYLNEFPNWDSNGRNLDWLLEQYSTFEKRLQELHDAFNDAVTNMEGQISNLESEYARQLDNFESRVNTSISNFESTINNEFDSFKDSVNNEVDSIRDVIEIVNENTEQYINQNIQSFLWNVVTVTLEKSANVSAEGNATIHFDSYTIPEGYASFVVVEYSEQYQNVIWVGGNVSPSVGVFPSLYYSKSGDNYNFTMNVYNPNTQGALDVTARIKLLLIPDTSMI